jgi:uncharacterized protein (TIGR02679 family)
VPTYLLEWADLPGVREVLAEARHRLERGRLRPAGRITVPLTAAERGNVGRLLDVTWVASGRPVGVRALRAGLAEHDTTVEDLLVAVGGPLRDLPAEKRERSLRAASELALGVEILVGALGVLGTAIEAGDRAALETALVRWVIRGRPPVAQAEAVARVVAGLPAAGPAGERLPVVAAALLGDAHALDRSRTLGRAVARYLVIQADYLAAKSAAAVYQGLATDPLTTAEGWRDAWAGAGVACDAVSARVLVLNLPLTGSAPAVALAAATPGEPVWLTLRSVTGELGTVATRVYVCENPSIVEAAADRLGTRCRPLVCTYGFPDLAALTLLRALARTATLYVRADGDAAGWKIVAGLAELPGVVRWRMPEGLAQFEEELLPELLADLDG